VLSNEASRIILAYLYVGKGSDRKFRIREAGTHRPGSGFSARIHTIVAKIPKNVETHLAEPETYCTVYPNIPAPTHRYFTYLDSK
jgi:hypothetical protein